jgi:N utilization substance protein A
VIILSRTSPLFLAKLLEIEVPEIFDGLITIKKIVREPGERAKVAVESFDDRIDPVGACVGMKGSRIHGIVRELKNENIDVINFTTNTQLLIQRSLTPSKISYMNIDAERKRAEVYLQSDQVSLAIGRRGVNIKLASELTGYELDVYREDEEIVDEFDIDLDEFSDEIESKDVELLQFKKERDELLQKIQEYEKGDLKYSKSKRETSAININSAIVEEPKEEYNTTTDSDLKVIEELKQKIEAHNKLLKDLSKQTKMSAAKELIADFKNKAITPALFKNNP